jgi:hypothetical protein
VSFDGMSRSIGILCFYNGIIINTDNDIVYNREINKFLTTTLDMFINKLSRMLCDRFGWNIYI